MPGRHSLLQGTSSELSPQLSTPSHQKRLATQRPFMQCRYPFLHLRLPAREEEEEEEEEKVSRRRASTPEGLRSLGTFQQGKKSQSRIREAAPSCRGVRDGV